MLLASATSLISTKTLLLLHPTSQLGTRTQTTKSVTPHRSKTSTSQMLYSSHVMPCPSMQNGYETYPVPKTTQTKQPFVASPRQHNIQLASSLYLVRQ